MKTLLPSLALLLSCIFCDSLLGRRQAQHPRHSRRRPWLGRTELPGVHSADSHAAHRQHRQERRAVHQRLRQRDVLQPHPAGFMTGRYQQRYGHEFNPGPRRRQTRISASRSKKPLSATASRVPATPPAGSANRTSATSRRSIRSGAASMSTTDSSAAPMPISTPRRTVRIRSCAARHRRPTPAATRRKPSAARPSAFIEKHHEQPWFVYLAFNAVHGPLEATEKYLSRFAHIADPKRRTYAAMQSAMDDAVGRCWPRSASTGRKRTR